MAPSSATPLKPSLPKNVQKNLDSLPVPSGKVKMMAFHWTKLPHSQVDKSMWPKLLRETSESKNIKKIDINRLESLFGSEVKQPPKKMDDAAVKEGCYLSLSLATTFLLSPLSNLATIGNLKRANRAIKIRGLLETVLSKMMASPPKRKKRNR